MIVRASILAAVVALGVVSLPGVATQSLARPVTVDPVAGDVSGTYTWEGMGGGGGGGGGGGQTTTLTLKQDGTKLTGTISGRGGDTEIEEGSVDGKNIKFNVTREFNGNKMVTKYTGTVDGDTLKLTSTVSRDIEAKKQKA